MNTDEFDEQQLQLAAAQKAREERDAAITKHQHILLKAALWRSCLNCMNWKDKTEVTNEKFNGQTKTYKHCGLYQQVPPPDVIVNGCRDWEDDIPF